MTTENFCFYLQNRLIQTSQTGGQRYSDISPFSIPWFTTLTITLKEVKKTEVIVIYFNLSVYPTQHSGYHMSLAKMDSAPSSSVVGIHALHTGNLQIHANSEASLLKMSDLPVPSR